ncbi:MAG TPA: ChbG/HpnK family deacetylase [Puia sp.]|nr:ChbG/HpnK family deacetylase [Puia sp.]
MPIEFFFHNISQNLNRFIINADDFGKNAEVNAAIYTSFKEELISSVSMLANMDGFHEAVDIANRDKEFAKNIGIHINLTEGYPLTDSIKKCKRFCHSNGYFIYNRNQPVFFLNKDERLAVYDEIKAQIKKLIDAGIRPSHADSHHHIHTEWGVLSVIIPVLKEYHISKIRSCRNLGSKNLLVKEVYKNAFNFYLKNIKGYAFSGYFGSIDDLMQSSYFVNAKNQLVEIMVHPMFDASGNLVDDDMRRLTDKLAPLIENCKIVTPDAN